MNEIPNGSPNDYENWRPKTGKRRVAFWMGVLVSDLVGLLTLLAVTLLHSQLTLPQAETYVAGYLASQFVVIPIGMGIVAAYFWRKLNFTTFEILLASFFITGGALLGSFLILREGVICLIMASPLLILFIMLGLMIGKILWARSNTWLGASTLPLMALMLIADAQMPHHHAAIVTDEVLIAAPPARVWRYVAGYPKIETPPRWWLWKIGLPFPVQSTSTGAFTGARRDCRFSGNVVFEEKITEVKANRALTFDVTKQPDHPEVTGHFNLDKGRFELRDNGDDTTTLRGTTWYRLHVYPSQYFDLWAESIVRHVHFRVMNHIKQLAERDQKNEQPRAVVYSTPQ